MFYFHKTTTQLLIISIFSIVVFLNTLPNTFILDDTDIFLNWPTMQKFDIGALAEGAYPPKFQGEAYRPVKAIIHAVEYRLWGQNTLFYHLQAILVNLLCTLLVYLIVKHISLMRPMRPIGPMTSLIPFLTALLFGIHPIHTESITFMTASFDSWGILFFFASFYSYLKSRRITSFVFAALAFFTYELTLTLPLIIVLYNLTLGYSSSERSESRSNSSILKSLIINLKSIWPYFLLALLFFIARLHFVGKLSTKTYVAGSFYLTMLSETKALVKYLQLLVFPVNLSINPVLPGGIESFINTFTDVSVIQNQSIFDLPILFSIVLIVFFIAFAIYSLKKFPLVTFCIFFFFVSLSPVLNIIPQNVLMAERYAYIASFGGVLLIVYACSMIYSKSSKVVKNCLVVFFIAVVLWFSFLTIKRNADYKDEYTMWQSLANASTQQATKRYYTGMYYFQKGEYEKAEAEFKKAVTLKPNYTIAYYHLGLNALNQGNYKSAREIYYKLKTLENNRNKSAIEGLIKEVQKYSKEYKNDSLSFYYPIDWTVTENGNEIVLQDVHYSFWINISQKPFSGSFANYLANHKQTLGILENEGLARIPVFDYAYVKMLSVENTKRMQFFLFKKQKVLEVWVWPSNSPYMKQFDNLVSSIEVYKY